jgi:hypothetical protein
MNFLGIVGPDMTESMVSGQGISLWQTAGGLVLVFGLLIVSLKFLGKFQRRSAHAQATVLAVWNLGPRREIQVLRLENEAHYIYRHDGAMVILKKTSFTEWEAENARPSSPAAKAGGMLGKLFPGWQSHNSQQTCDLEA